MIGGGTGGGRQRGNEDINRCVFKPFSTSILTLVYAYRISFNLELHSALSHLFVLQYDPVPALSLLFQLPQV